MRLLPIVRPRVRRLSQDRCSTRRPTDWVEEARPPASFRHPAPTLIYLSLMSGSRGSPAPGPTAISRVFRPIIAWAMVVRVSDDLDWAHLLREGRRRDATVALAAALELAREYEPGIPLAVVCDLKRVKPGRLVSLDICAQQSPDSDLVLAARTVMPYLHMAGRRRVGGTFLDFHVLLECSRVLDCQLPVPRTTLRRVD